MKPYTNKYQRIHQKIFYAKKTPKELKGEEQSPLKPWEMSQTHFHLGYCKR